MPHCYRYVKNEQDVEQACQCPLGLMPHCYRDTSLRSLPIISKVSMPSRANASLLPVREENTGKGLSMVSMPSRANASLLLCSSTFTMNTDLKVSMPSRANASLLPNPMMSRFS